MYTRGMKFSHRPLHTLVIVVLVIVLGTAAVSAQKQNPTAGSAPCSTAGSAPCTQTNPNSTSSGFNLNIKLNNPLKVNTIQDAIKLFVNAIVRLAIPVIVIFFLWSGLMFIFARGNPEKIRVAKNMFFYTIIGTLLILGAWTITNALVGTVNSITS